MIGRITGTLIEKLPPTICVDVGGLGYDIDVPMSTLYALPDNGARVTLYTHLTVREDAHILYGFATAGERSAFRELIKVSGIGARTALAVLSGLSVADLAQAITLPASARKPPNACCWKCAASSAPTSARPRTPRPTASRTS